MNDAGNLSMQQLCRQAGDVQAFTLINEVQRLLEECQRTEDGVATAPWAVAFHFLPVRDLSLDRQLKELAAKF